MFSSAASAQLAQLGEGTAEVYSLTQPTRLERCNAGGELVSVDGTVLVNDGTPVVERAEGGSAFYLIARTPERVVLEFLPWTSDGDKDKNTRLIGSGPLAHLWCLDNVVATARTAKYFERGSLSFSYGLLLVPFKVRPGWGDTVFDFSSDVSVAGAAGGSVQLGRYYDLRAHLVAFTALGVANVKPSKKESTSTADASQNQTRSVSTFSAGAGLGISIENAAAGLLVGWDFVSDNDQLDWDRQGHTWFGISLGATFGPTGPPSQ
jgi:hypothetical protein